MLPADNMDGFINHAETHLKEKGITGWQVHILGVDSEGARVSLD